MRESNSCCGDNGPYRRGEIFQRNMNESTEKTKVEVGWKCPTADSWSNKSSVLGTARDYKLSWTLVCDYSS